MCKPARFGIAETSAAPKGRNESHRLAELRLEAVLKMVQNLKKEMGAYASAGAELLLYAAVVEMIEPSADALK